MFNPTHIYLLFNNLKVIIINRIKMSNISINALSHILADAMPNVPQTKIATIIDNIKLSLPVETLDDLNNSTNSGGSSNVSISDYIDEPKSGGSGGGSGNICIDMSNNSVIIPPSPLRPIQPTGSAQHNQQQINENQFKSDMQNVYNDMKTREAKADPDKSTSSFEKWFHGLLGLSNKSKKRFHLLKPGSSDLDREILSYIKKINKDIGYYWWKQYIYYTFWNNINTPINLTITILTALTTGKNITQEIISENTATIFGSVVILLSIFTTFFKPTEKTNKNNVILKRWADIGYRFDNIYLDKVSEENSYEEKKIKLQKLQELFRDMSNLKKENESNLIIDTIFSCAKKMCLMRNDRLYWMPEAISPDDDDI